VTSGRKDESGRRGLQGRLERRLMARPPKPLKAASAIAGVSLVVSILAGLVANWIDAIDTWWLGVYWAVQTVTTVGFGDVVPTGTRGQALSILVMLIGTAFVAVVTAAVTSIFIERARTLHEAEEQPMEDQAHVALDEIGLRLDRIETLLRDSAR
jgi:voltage-gated potassium channel